eukprot:TRINITY_DN3172_c0_g1_i14.p8 TRINITY_DN3172_c0_g1~~TRINITY_DN3172_c0_g1_i14.p8  ORF type:complete len:106 (-),score=3.95 TRINITY_DN3172_c0_g1_i14:172-489(-)
MFLEEVAQVRLTEIIIDSLLLQFTLIGMLNQVGVYNVGQLLPWSFSCYQRLLIWNSATKQVVETLFYKGGVFLKESFYDLLIRRFSVKGSLFLQITILRWKKETK